MVPNRLKHHQTRFKTPENRGSRHLERFANRTVSCKYIVHADLLEGPQDQGGGRRRAGYPQKGGR
jgi:hypothetical protein